MDGIKLVRKIGTIFTDAFNRVALEDSSGSVISATNPLPISDTALIELIVSAIAVRTNVNRATPAVHRSAIVAVDKVADIANTDLTTADNGAATGSLNASTTFYVTAIPGNRYGTCKVAGTINTQATGASGLNTHSIRLTIPQKTGAEWYDIMLSTDAAPKWVGRITEAQRAAGDYEITAVGTVAAGGGNPAGTVDINVVGTGIQTSNAVFAQSNAYTPASVTGINCAGYSKIHVFVELIVTDLRAAPALNVVPFLYNATNTSWCAGNLQAVNVMQGLGQPLKQDFYISVDGASGLVVLVDTISGQGASVSMWVELV